MMRVLHLIKSLGRGGAEQLLLNQAPYLDRHRFHHEAAYLLPDINALVAEVRSAGLPVHCLDGSRGAGWIVRLRRLVRERAIDLVHVHSPYAAIGARLAWWGHSRPRLVYTEHNVWEAYHRATYWGNLLTYGRNDYVLAVSEHVRASISYPAALQFLRLPRIETLYHGVDLAAVDRWGSSDGVRSDLGIPEGVPLVGTVANFRPSKGHQVLVEAAARVRESVPDVRFVLVGLGPMELQVRRQVQDLHLEGTVIFAGPRGDAPRIAGACDVFTLPSIHEGLAIALIEAMALGRPAVVTRAGGLTEVIEHEKQGLVVPPKDPGALANAITKLLQDASLRRTLGEAGRLRARDFDIRKAVHRLEEIYVGLLS